MRWAENRRIDVGSERTTKQDEGVRRKGNFQTEPGKERTKVWKLRVIKTDGYVPAA